MERMGSMLSGLGDYVGVVATVESLLRTNGEGDERLVEVEYQMRLKILRRAKRAAHAF